jgi:hypothetical protein
MQSRSVTLQANSHSETSVGLLHSPFERTVFAGHVLARFLVSHAMVSC